MRQLLLQVPPDSADVVVEAARSVGAATLTRWDGQGGDGDRVVVVCCSVPNSAVGDLLDAAQSHGPVEALVPSAGVFAFEPPAGEVPEELADVSARSLHEVVLAARQATGGWQGYLVYAVLAGVVAWLGLYTESIYLLTASMLIAPFAGPATNTAIAITTGRVPLLRSSMARYAAGIGVTAAVGALLALAVGQQGATTLMTSVLTVTIVTFLLPLAAGVAAATFLVQSEHSSLISGAAVGILVAASLAPPAAALGVATAIGRLDLAWHAVFLVALQLAGISLSAGLTFRLYGMQPSGGRYAVDRPAVLRLGLGFSAVVVAALVGLQLVAAPSLVQGSRAREAADVVRETMERRDDVRVLSVDPAVASAAPSGPPRIVVQVVAERAVPGSDVPSAETVEEALRAALTARLDDVVTHVVVTVVAAPPPSG